MFGATAFVLICVLGLAVATLVPARARPVVWCVVVAAGVVPWGSWAGHAHLERVEWIPFSTIIRQRDIFLNVLLYIPMGVFVFQARRLRDGWQGIVVAALSGLVLSLVTEATQVFSHRRFPGTSDVVTNTLGAFIGAWLAGWRHSVGRVRESS